MEAEQTKRSDIKNYYMENYSFSRYICIIAWVITGNWKMGRIDCRNRGAYKNVFLLFS